MRYGLHRRVCRVLMLIVAHSVCILIPQWYDAYGFEIMDLCTGVPGVAVLGDSNAYVVQTWVLPFTSVVLCGACLS